jgi:hypothetical protein
MMPATRGRWTMPKVVRAVTAIIVLLLAYGLWATWYKGEFDQPDWWLRVIDHAITW